ncbi:MAG: hypothetical protein M3N82_05550 [Pseudomonadota bacterium]|nr:hypothetical protein [Pseudomonadota bacterium]
MWWDRSELAEIYLSPHCIGMVSRRAGAANWAETQGVEEGLEGLAQALRQAPLQSCGRLRVWLGSALARPLILSATSGARNREEAKGLATMLAPEATGFDEPVRVWASAWRVNHGGLAVVMPQSLWAALNKVVEQERDRRRRVRSKDVARSLELVSVRPWWNHAIDAVIADSAREANRIGWSFAEDGGVVHGIVDKGQPIEAGFDLLGAHDADGALLRRRLQVNWEAVAAARHLEFVRDGGTTPVSLGSWRDSSGSRA